MPHRYARIYKSINSDGDNLSESRNTHMAFDSYLIEDSKFLFYITNNAKDCYDNSFQGFKSERLYEIAHGFGGNNTSFGVRNYFNQESLYNETIAQEYFPLNKEEALKQGYLWEDGEKRNYKINIENKDIPDDIQDITDNIINKVIACEHSGKCKEQCTEAFKIIPEEFKFYKRMNLPLPRLCPNCRHYQRLKLRNPLKLWERKCMCEGKNHFHGAEKCEIEFKTSYAPDRPEIIYCEKCYQQEVY
jgi:hypothetical protein